MKLSSLELVLLESLLMVVERLISKDYHAVGSSTNALECSRTGRSWCSVNVPETKQTN